VELTIAFVTPAQLPSQYDAAAKPACSVREAATFPTGRQGGGVH
jgi:hypothetical protein